jgi:hypothetical protein
MGLLKNSRSSGILLSTMVSDIELEAICRKVLSADENRFTVVLYKHGKSMLGHLVDRVSREVPKAELSKDLLLRAHQMLARLLDETSN